MVIINTNVTPVSFALKEIQKVHGNRDVTVTVKVTRELYINDFIILEFLGLEYGKIDTRIKSVTSVLDEIRKVTEIVTSQSLS